MIFTGVTGGEIVSLLYPLFILSPFCYIIISKESLDGHASDAARHGTPTAADGAASAENSRVSGSGRRYGAVWHVYRQRNGDRACSGDVCGADGSCRSGKDV